MGKTPTGTKAVAKMPPKKAFNTGTEHMWRSPRNHKTTRQLESLVQGGAREVADQKVGEGKRRRITRCHHHPIHHRTKSRNQTKGANIAMILLEEGRR